MYIKSTWELDLKCEHMELVLETFEHKLEKLFEHSHKQLYEINLPKDEIKTLKQMKKDNKLIVLNTGKNLGPAIMETTKDYLRAFQDHLSNQKNYQEK